MLPLEAAANALVPVPPTVSYARAVELAEGLRKDVAAVTSVKGQAYAKTLLEVWSNRWEQGAYFAFGGIAITGALVAGASWLDGHGVFALFSGSVAALSGISGLIQYARNKHLLAAYHRNETMLFGSDDLQRMLRTFTQATPHEQTVLAPIVDAALGKIDQQLSAKAALLRDQLVSELPPIPPAGARASVVAAVIDSLRNGDRLVAKHISTLDLAIREAGPDERLIIASTLEGALFASEKSRFDGSTENARALYRLINDARAGKSRSAE